MSAAPHPNSYYAATASERRSRPRLEADLECDVCVVGGGYTGLSAALHLAERGYDVALLEARRIGWGASGRNGGQLQPGQRLSAAALIERLGAATARQLWLLAEEARALVAELLARHRIACDFKPGVLIAAAKPRDMARLARDVACLAETFDYPHARLVGRAEIREMVASPRFHGGMLDAAGGHLHPLNFALGLARAAEAGGARLFEDTPVTAIDQGARCRLRVPGATVRARHVALCCNGYLDRLMPRLAGRIMPIDNYMLATEPLGEEGARALIRDDVAVSDTKFVVDYFRLSADRRLLFGGGETYSGRAPEPLKPFVRKHMLEIFPQLAGARIDYAWGGRLAITMDRLPDFGRLGGNLFYAHGFSGHGVMLTALAGKLLAEAIAGTAERFDVFARLPHRSFPGGTWLRQPALALGMLYYSLRDRL